MYTYRWRERIVTRERTEEDSVVPLTAARARLFELVERLLSGRARRVVLTHRGHDARVVLIAETRLEGLEADLAALRARLGPEPRPLRGMATLHVDPDEVLGATRATARELAERKLESLSASAA
jgi:hypothetical protein